MRITRNQAKVEKTSATCNNKRWFVGNLHRSRLTRLETWDGWLLAGNTHNIFLMQNKLILHGYIHYKTILFFLIFPHIFQTQQKNFCSYWRIFQIIPYLTSHPKDREVNVCKHKFACTNVTPKRRNGAHFITHAPHCAWVISLESLNVSRMLIFPKSVRFRLFRQFSVFSKFSTFLQNSTHLFCWNA